MAKSRFEKESHLAKLAKCEDALKRMGLIRILCEAIEEARKDSKVTIKDDVRGELLAVLSQQAGKDRVAQRREILEWFCAKYNF